MNSRQVNVGVIQIFLAQFQALKLRKEILNADLCGIKFTKCKYIVRSFETHIIFFLSHYTYILYNSFTGKKFNLEKNRAKGFWH